MGPDFGVCAWCGDSGQVDSHRHDEPVCRACHFEQREAFGPGDAPLADQIRWAIMDESFQATEYSLAAADAVLALLAEHGVPTQPTNQGEQP